MRSRSRSISSRRSAEALATIGPGTALGGPTGDGRAAPTLQNPSHGTRARAALNRSFSVATGSAALLPVLALFAMIGILVAEAWPAIRFNGLGFFTGKTWDIGSLYSAPVTTNGVTHLQGAQYGALPLIVGTLESAAIALLLGFPVALGAAVLVAERLRGRLAATMSVVLQVLAGIPSVVYGLWGVLVLGPFLAAHVYPALTHIPLHIFAGPVGYGQGLLSSGIVLAVMIIPIIAATTRDLLQTVPRATSEGAEALGMTDAEVFRKVQARWVRSGVIGAAVLGLGRALGETIAIAMIAGGSPGAFTSNIYGTMTTIAATIVNQLDSAQIDPTHLAVASLAEAALVLLAIALAVNVAARLIVRRSATSVALPVGTGF